MAPEVMLGHPYDLKADVFSFGMVLVEIMTRAKVGEDIRRGPETLFKVDQSLLEGMVPHDCPPAFIQLALQCCAQDSNTRPTFKEVTKALKEMVQVLKNMTDVRNRVVTACREERSLSPPPAHRAINTVNKKSAKKSNTENENLLKTGYSVPPPDNSSKKKDKGFLRIPLLKHSPATSELVKPTQWTSSWEQPPIRPAMSDPTHYRGVNNGVFFPNNVSANPLYQPVFAESALHDHKSNISERRVQFEVNN